MIYGLDIEYYGYRKVATGHLGNRKNSFDGHIHFIEFTINDRDIKLGDFLLIFSYRTNTYLKIVMG